MTAKRALRFYTARELTTLFPPRARFAGLPWPPPVSPDALYGLDEVTFEVSMTLVHRLAQLKLRPRRRANRRWSFTCPSCWERDAGVLVALATGNVVSCRYGCRRSVIVQFIDPSA